MIERVPAALAGERVDRAVSLMTGASRAEAAELVTAGRVLVNGVAVKTKSHRVEEGDRLEVDRPLPGPGAGPQPDPAVAFEVLHEDPDVVIVDKPPGLVVHPGAGCRVGTLVNGLLARYPEIATVGPEPQRPGIVHRLDRDTSGLMVVARTAAAYDGLVEALAARRVERRYQALAWGAFESARGVVDAPIGRSARDPTRMAVATGGREARTRYEVVRSFHEPVAVTLLRCQLETGRTHQIRVHLAAIGHPVVGDERYGGARPSLPVPRIFLHAGELRFEHPVTGATIAVESPLPTDLRRVLDRLS
ncbi:RluA family pseudouridine synthase [Rhabdothermincola sediminis]|uniref:RluA family pseudouridine synthase n=1 Tax=Rhabdothermincola sediminis TaxID=2751370 RepID=UPI001AA0485A|nr:RluA family pseudouridine synthase [Rhabdothermincola sediminis]